MLPALHHSSGRSSLRPLAWLRPLRPWAWLRPLCLLAASAVAGVLAFRSWRALQDAVLLAHVGPSMTDAARADALAATVALGALSLCLAWTATVLTLASLGQLPGVAGAVLRRASAALTPKAARAALALACGVGPAALAVAPANAAGSASAVTVASGGSPEQGRTTTGGLELPALDRPGAPAGTGDSPQSLVDDDDVAPVYVVKPGDSLWSLTRAWLQSHQPSVSDSAVAREWPRWYRANRQEIGGDPSVIHPGERLVPPPRS